MLKMFLIIYVLAGPTLAGILMTIALAARLSSPMVVGLALVGFVLALPVAWVVGKMIYERTTGKHA